MITMATSLINQVREISSSGNISIPVDQLPAIQASIISTSAEAAVLFFFIGLGMGIGFSYLYFRIWKKACIVEPEEEKKEKGS
jgi:hypothetical protein